MGRRASGFTLIELMVVVAIIGVLASIALPTFQNLTYRARGAERAAMTAAINNAISDYWVRNGRFPNGTPPSTSMSLPSNPGFPLASYKRPMRMARYGDWGLLSLNPEGGVYFSYWGVVNANGGIRTHLIWGDRDLDGGGRQPYTTDIWTYRSEVLVSHTFSDNAGPFDW